MNKRKKLILALLFSLWSIMGCEADVANRVGVSSSSFIIGLKAIYGNFGLPADGSSQATIRVELFTNAGLLVDGQTVALTTTLGTLADTGATSTTNGGALVVTTANGVAIATLTSEAVSGTAFVVASVENISATVAVPFVNITSAAS